MSQRTLVLLKPDTVRRGLVGRGARPVRGQGAPDRRDGPAHDRRLSWPTSTTPSTSRRRFYPPLRDFVTSGPLVALVLEGDEAIEVVRVLNGATDGRKAAPGTIRGDHSLSNRENLVHGSDSEESAAREIKIWFPDLP